MKKKLLSVIITASMVQVLGGSLVLGEEVTQNLMTTNQGIDYEYIESQKPLDEAKTKLAKAANEKKVASKKGIATLVSITCKQNQVGTAKQVNDDYCGPASTYNLVYGYDIANYGRYSTFARYGDPMNPQVATQYSFAVDLQTKVGTGETAGTAFGQLWPNILNYYATGNNYVLKVGTALNWDNEVRNAVQYTVDKDNGYEKKNYNVIVDMYKTNSLPGIGGYYNSPIAHYLVAYGYNTSNDQAYISDSKVGLPSTYAASFYLLDRDCQRRRIVW